MRWKTKTARLLVAFPLFAGFTFEVGATEASLQNPSKTESKTRFASTVQLALHEPNPMLMKRAQNLVVQEFEKNLHGVPALRQARMSVQRSGNEVVFSLLTEEDLRAPMREVLVHMIQSLNGRVRARGRTSFYRTSFSHPPQAEFFLTVHDPEKRTLYIEAEQAPLIDLLQEMRRQMPGFSYIIPQECAQRRVYWTFGDPDPSKHPAHLELRSAMKGIAEMLQIKVENLNGAFVFSGDCRAGAMAEGESSRKRAQARTLREPAVDVRPETEWEWPVEILPMRWPAPVAPLAPKPQRHVVPVGIEEAPVAVNVPRRAPPLLQSNVPVQVYLPVTPLEVEH